MPPDPVYLQLAMVVCTVIGTVIGTTWRVSRIVGKYDTTLIELMSQHELADTRRFADTRAYIIEMGDTVRREVGEEGHAIRQKIYEIEMWGRDNYVPIENFNDSTKRLETDLRELTSKVENRLYPTGGRARG